MNRDVGVAWPFLPSFCSIFLEKIFPCKFLASGKERKGKAPIVPMNRKRENHLSDHSVGCARLESTLPKRHDDVHLGLHLKGCTSSGIPPPYHGSDLRRPLLYKRTSEWRRCVGSTVRVNDANGVNARPLLDKVKCAPLLNEGSQQKKVRLKKGTA